jgi:release factor glutamine methyltransferase
VRWIAQHARDPEAGPVAEPVVQRPPVDRAPRAAADRYRALLARRIDGEPLAYVLGTQPFGPHSFVVTPATLIPRPETWTLVEHALATLPTTPPRILDLGTGSGCIAISLALARPDATVVAVDASTDALAVARENAARLGAGERILWCAGDWYDALVGAPPGAGAPFDLIVANPPYVAVDDPHLDALTREPVLALVSGPQGLDALRILVAGARARLTPGGRLAVEHGHDQRRALTGLFEQAGFTSIVTLEDAAGVDRVVSGCRPPR